jgi:hypothetical protein
MTIDFNVDGYRALIAQFGTLRYAVTGFDDAEPAARHLILRHDVDFCIESALELAGAEAALGVAATYFIQTRSVFYNPLAPNARAGLAELRRLGHVIGLHFDPRGHDGDGAIEAAIAADAEILAEASGGAVTAVSFHRPPKAQLGGAVKLAGLWNAYAQRFIADTGYCSDSRGTWRFGEPLAHPAVHAGRALQLLTHPIWWTGATAEPHQRLQRFLDAAVRGLDRELAANCEVHVAGTAEISFRGVAS